MGSRQAGSLNVRLLHLGAIQLASFFPAVFNLRFYPRQQQHSLGSGDRFRWVDRNAGNRKAEPVRAALIQPPERGEELARNPQPTGGPLAGGRTGKREQPILRKTAGVAGMRSQSSGPFGTVLGTEPIAYKRLSTTGLHPYPSISLSSKETVDESLGLLGASCLCWSFCIETMLKGNRMLQHHCQCSKLAWNSKPSCLSFLCADQNIHSGSL